jgi:hypothetical protein
MRIGSGRIRWNFVYDPKLNHGGEAGSGSPVTIARKGKQRSVRMLKKLVIGIAILAASLGYGCVAHAQCPGGQCQVQQATYSTPVRNAVYATAQAMTQATAPKQCPTSERRQPIRDAIRKVFGGKCK